MQAASVAHLVNRDRGKFPKTGARLTSPCDPYVAESSCDFATLNEPGHSVKEG
jgi:hypothetical protein